MTERSTSRRQVGYWREALVVIEVALALVLLIGTILFVRTYLTLRPAHPGFALENRITARVSLPDERMARRRRSDHICDRCSIASPVPAQAWRSPP